MLIVDPSFFVQKKVQLAKIKEIGTNVNYSQ